MLDFKEKTALITGGGGYIGGECAFRLASLGANVAVCDISRESLDRTVDRIRNAGGKARGYLIDVTNSESVNEVVDKVCCDLGKLDISIHVAGGSARIAGADAKYLPLYEQEDKVIDSVLKVNLYGAIYVARAAARKMISQGCGGRIISFSSVVGLNGLSTCTEYAAAKGGVISMTKSLAKEVGQFGITVNTVAPGIVVRPDENVSPDRAYNTNFLHKKCTAANVADLVAFLASEEAGFITGQTYVCDGGRSLAMKGSD